MFKPHTVLGFGLWLVAVSFLGVPATWKIRLYLATGIVFVLIYLFYLGREALFKLAEDETRRADTFTESTVSTQKDISSSKVSQS